MGKMVQNLPALCLWQEFLFVQNKVTDALGAKQVCWSSDCFNPIPSGSYWNCNY